MPQNPAQLNVYCRYEQTSIKPCAPVSVYVTEDSTIPPLASQNMTEQKTVLESYIHITVLQNDPSAE